MADKKKAQKDPDEKENPEEEQQEEPAPIKQNWEEKYERFELPKPSLVKIPIEELDAKIQDAENRLREMGLEHEVWLKHPLDVDASYHLCFSLLEDPKGLIMVQQVAGQTLRLMDAPRFLKQGGCKQLEELIEFAPVAQEKAKAAAEEPDDESRLEDLKEKQPPGQKPKKKK